MINLIYMLTIMLGMGVPASIWLAVLVGRLIKRNGDDQPMANPYYDPNWLKDIEFDKKAVAGDWHDPLPGEQVMTAGYGHAGSTFTLEEFDAIKMQVIAKGEQPASYTDARHSRPFFGQAPHKYVPGIPAFVYYSAEAGNFYWAGDGGALGLGNEFHAAWLPWAHLFPQSGEGFKP